MSLKKHTHTLLFDSSSCDRLLELVMIIMKVVNKIITHVCSILVYELIKLIRSTHLRTQFRYGTKHQLYNLKSQLFTSSNK